MWQYGINDVPVCDPSLTNVFGLGNVNHGFTQPTFVNPLNTIGGLPYGTLPMGFTPFVHPLNFVKPEFHPFFGLRTEWNPFVGPVTNFVPTIWGQPFGFDRLGTMKLDTLGINPWFVGGPIGLRLTEELWKNTLPFTQPIYGQNVPFTGQFGWFGNPLGINGYTPFGFTGIDERMKFNTPIQNGLFGLQTTPCQTPIDWKVKTFGTPMGVTTETWNKPLFTNVPWTTGRVPGSVAVL